MTTPAPAYQDSPVLDLTAVPGAQSVYFAASAAGKLLVSGRGLWVGCYLLNGDGAAGHAFNLRDGTDVNGQIIAPVRLGTNANQSISLALPGVMYEQGLFIDDVSGFVQGTVWIIPLQ